MTLPTFDQAAFDHLLEITGNDLEFVDELIDTYLADASLQLEAMQAAASSGDAAALVRPAHSLKSSSANVGAMALADICRALEAAARTGDVPDASERVADCDRALADARATLLAARAAR
jgi:HPt (histidine-containing phosphotransfer) domain-containing protein